MFRGDNDRCGCGHHHGVEVACRERVSQVAQVIAREGMNERKVSMERDLEQILAAIDGDLLLTLFYDCPDSRGGQDTAQP